MATPPFRLERGAWFVSPREVAFAVWAPRAAALSVQIIDGPLVPLRRAADGVYTGTVTLPAPASAVDYFYVLDGDKRRPDPVSRWQPHGVHGPSRVVPVAAWTQDGPGDGAADGWRGIPLQQYVLYELHVGTFTPQGSFAAAIERLPYLRDLGVTAIELMPVAQFPGARNWGYDGVYPYAPQHEYGGPQGLQALCRAAHRLGLAVVLDVVYNHLGPEGNYLHDYGPYFGDRYRTPWGDALNFDGPGSDQVRRYFIDNALYWLTEFGIDALRLDAVHAMLDFSARPILQELGDAIHAQAQRLGRPAYVIAESDLNDVRVVQPASAGGYGLDAQWSDDFHHALHALLYGARHSYFADFGRLRDLETALAEGYVYQGQYSVFRQRHHGSSPADLRGDQLVIYTENHDQVANGRGGQREATVQTLAQQKLAAMVLLCAPCIPMLFMGQEYGATTPFHFFTSFLDEDLGAAIGRHRAREIHAHFPRLPFAAPQDEQTFARSKLCWDELERPPHRQLLGFYRALLALRRQTPALANCRKDLTRVHASEPARWLVVERGDDSGASALLLCNFAPCAQRISLRECVLHSTAPRCLALCSWEAMAREMGGEMGGTMGGTMGGDPPPPECVGGHATTTVTLPPYSAVLYIASA